MIQKTVTLKNSLPEFFRKKIKGSQIISYPIGKDIDASFDSQNRISVNINMLKQQIDKDKDAAALAWHGNNFDVRLDDCGFPKDRLDRKFILTHNFGEQLSKILEHLKNGKWVYLYGHSGQGKTAIATRAIWEILKKKPAAKATFISVNSWIRDHFDDSDKMIMDDPKPTPLRKFVLLDDLDKFDKNKEFQNRLVLDLIERLKSQGAIVLITAQYSPSEILSRYRYNYDLAAALDRIRGKSIIISKFEGKSKR